MEGNLPDNTIVHKEANDVFEGSRERTIFASSNEYILLDRLVTPVNIYHSLWIGTIHNVINSNNDKLNAKWIEKHKVIIDSS